MKIVPLCPDSYAANTYLLVSDGKAFVVDPSISVAAVEKALTLEKAELCGILLTHGHFDHTISVDTLRSKFSVPLMIHTDDAPMLTNGLINGFYDFYGKECVHQKADKLLCANDKIQLGNESIKVISTPGHSPGSVCFLCKDNLSQDFLITGDTLFSTSIGRCDLWQGNEEQMKNSISMLSEFDVTMTIYPGHGSSSSLSVALNAARYYLNF